VLERVQEFLRGRFVTGMRIAAVTALGFVLSGCITDVSVARHSSVALTNLETGQILADFSAAINTADSRFDVACATDLVGPLFPALYFQDGDVGIYNGPGVINEQADFLALFQEPGYVKVVSAINWCGDFGPNIIGCAPIPGNTFAVVRIAPELEGSLWAHEFGHTVGLEHRNDNRAVMRGTLGSNTREVNSDECEQFLEKVNLDYYNTGAAAVAASAQRSAGEAFAAPSGQSLSFDAEVLSMNVEPQIGSILDFVRQIYPHGTPMEALAAFEGDAQLPALRAMLADSADAAFWGNVVVALGMLGDASDVSLLIQFANAEATRPDDAGLVNASAALMALGYLANRTGDAEALAYLNRQMQADAWQHPAASGQQLAATAHIGMAFSGQLPGVAQSSSRSAQASPVVSAGMSAELEELRAQIASQGVRNYYRRR